jgi:NAD(P)-dependent dehydrogenase (short-subunit alcohol dehydrogenase family)
MDLVGRTALVTGGAAGTGRAIARRLEVEGARVVVADLVHGDVGRFVKTDVTNPDPRLFEGVDVLINNAGGGHLPPHFPEPGWEAKLDLNLRAPMLATQLALERGVQAIVNVASSAGRETDVHPFPDYAAAKAGLIRFTTACETPPGVRMNCVVPGWILTERAQEELDAMTPQERAAASPAIGMDVVAGEVFRLVADDALNHQVVVL